MWAKEVDRSLVELVDPRLESVLAHSVHALEGALADAQKQVAGLEAAMARAGDAPLDELCSLLGDPAWADAADTVGSVARDVLRPAVAAEAAAADERSKLRDVARAAVEARVRDARADAAAAIAGIAAESDRQRAALAAAVL